MFNIWRLLIYTFYPRMVTRMNTDTYRNFLEVVDLGTISAASRKLHIAQPALSNQMRSLEEHYGAQLMIRGARKVSLTPAGEILYKTAENILRLEKIAENEIQEQSHGNAGIINIGLVCAPHEKELSSLLTDFNSAYPSIGYYIRELSSPEIMQMLIDGTTDIGFLRCPDALPSCFSYVFSKTSKYRVYYSRRNTHFNGEEGPVDVRELKGLPICIPSAIVPRFRAACDAAGFTPNIVSVCSTFPQTQIWANSADSIAIAASISGDCGDGIICRPLKGDTLQTVQYICYNNERPVSAYVKKFIDFCTEYFK